MKLSIVCQISLHYGEFEGTMHEILTKVYIKCTLKVNIVKNILEHYVILSTGNGQW